MKWKQPQSLPRMKSPGPDSFSTTCYQTFKEELTSALLKLSNEIEREGTLPNSFYEASFTLILKLEKTIAKEENYNEHRCKKSSIQ
jgi:hypothetical protein